MNKFFVTREIAEKLRAKGYIMDVHYENELDINKVYSINNLIIYKLPRIDEVLAWLREEKKIHIPIDFYCFNGGTKLVWFYNIRGLEEDFNYYIDMENIKGSYLDAVLSGIEYVLDNLI